MYKLLESCTSLFSRRAKLLAQLKINFQDCFLSNVLQSSSESKVLHAWDPMTDLAQALLKTKEGEKRKAKGRMRGMVLLAKEDISEERKRKTE